MMEFTAEMIAGFLGGQVAGDKEAKVHTVSSIEEGEPGALTYLTNPKYEKHLYKTRASIVLVNKDFTPSEPVTATLIKVEDTGAAVLKLLQMYQAAKPRKQGISERASISERATLAKIVTWAISPLSRREPASAPTAKSIPRSISVTA